MSKVRYSYFSRLNSNSWLFYFNCWKWKKTLYCKKLTLIFSKETKLHHCLREVDPQLNLNTEMEEEMEHVQEHCICQTLTPQSDPCFHSLLSAHVLRGRPWERFAGLGQTSLSWTTCDRMWTEGCFSSLSLLFCPRTQLDYSGAALIPSNPHSSQRFNMPVEFDIWLNLDGTLMTWSLWLHVQTITDSREHFWIEFNT